MAQAAAPAAGSASVTAHRFRALAGKRPVPRVVGRPVEVATPLPVPLIAVSPTSEGHPAALERFLSQQTESSISIGPGSASPFVYMPDGRGLEDLPPTHLESMVMVAAAEELDQVVAGWAAPCRRTLRAHRSGLAAQFHRSRKPPVAAPSRG